MLPGSTLPPDYRLVPSAPVAQLDRAPGFEPVLDCPESSTNPGFIGDNAVPQRTPGDRKGLSGTEMAGSTAGSTRREFVGHDLVQNLHPRPVPVQVEDATTSAPSRLRVGSPGCRGSATVAPPGRGHTGRPDQCQPSGPPRPWTPPLPWTPRASTGAWKTARTAVSHSAHRHHPWFSHHDLKTRSPTQCATWCREIRRFRRSLAPIQDPDLRLARKG